MLPHPSTCDTPDAEDRFASVDTAAYVLADQVLRIDVWAGDVPLRILHIHPGSNDEETADGTAACDQSIVAAATRLRRKQRYTHMSCRVVVETYMNTRYT